MNRLACVPCASKQNINLSGDPVAMGACFKCGTPTVWREATAAEADEPGRPIGTPPHHEEITTLTVTGRHTCLACAEQKKISTTYPRRSPIDHCQFCDYPSAYREEIEIAVPAPTACPFCTVTRVRSAAQTPS